MVQNGDKEEDEERNYRARITVYLPESRVRKFKFPSRIATFPSISYVLSLSKAQKILFLATR